MTETVTSEKIRLRYRMLGVSILPIYIIISASFVNLFIGIIRKFDGNIIAGSFSTALINVVMIAIIFILSRGIERKSFKEIFRFKKLSSKNLFISILTGIWLYFGIQILSALINILFGSDDPILKSSDTSQRINETMTTSVFSILLLVITTVILAPMLEELIFRAGIFGSLEKSRENREKISMLTLGFSSILFGLAHYQGFSTITDWFVICWTGFSGGIFCLLYFKTKSILASMIAHSIYNGLTMGMALLLI